MIRSPVNLSLPDSLATARIARAMALGLRPGDCLLLDGPVGAGKTHFARHLIQSMLVDPEDVPSPTYTLVQIYDTDAGPLWHADLYRLAEIDEIEELGLTEAFEQAICLIEWPDRLGPLAPAHAIWISLEPDPASEEARRMTLSWTDPKWASVMQGLSDD